MKITNFFESDLNINFFLWGVCPGYGDRFRGWPRTSNHIYIILHNDCFTRFCLRVALWSCCTLNMRWTKKISIFLRPAMPSFWWCCLYRIFLQKRQKVLKNNGTKLIFSKILLHVVWQWFHLSLKPGELAVLVNRWCHVTVKSGLYNPEMKPYQQDSAHTIFQESLPMLSWQPLIFHPQLLLTMYVKSSIQLLLSYRHQHPMHLWRYLIILIMCHFLLHWQGFICFQKKKLRSVLCFSRWNIIPLFRGNLLRRELWESDHRKLKKACRLFWGYRLDCSVHIEDINAMTQCVNNYIIFCVDNPIPTINLGSPVTQRDKKKTFREEIREILRSILKALKIKIIPKLISLQVNL